MKSTRPGANCFRNRCSSCFTIPSTWAQTKTTITNYISVRLGIVLCTISPNILTAMCVQKQHIPQQAFLHYFQSPVSLLSSPRVALLGRYLAETSRVTISWSAHNQEHTFTKWSALSSGASYRMKHPNNKPHILQCKAFIYCFRPQQEWRSSTRNNIDSKIHDHR